ncbi:MAG: DUF1573 domain-containing protein [Candidatus Peregrinibacteria bacterium]|nr:DUF1573 domain-containing protein [Candidatus Peregrinibacteria bacterium]
MKKLLTLFAIVTMLILAGCSSAGVPNSVVNAIVVTPSSFDFGEIIQSEGTVSTTFEIENISDETLVINRLSTSCGCTTTEMDMADLEPGEVRTMKVTFDPMTHPEQSGTIERVVYLQTSDPNQPEIQIDITGFVVK